VAVAIVSNAPSPQLSDPDPLRSLDPEIVGDDESLSEAVDAFIHQETVANQRGHVIADHQELLRQTVDAEMWKLVLLIDEMIVERWADVAVEIARWSFGAGRRFPLAPSGEGPS
jgi:hypothetical protein